MIGGYLVHLRNGKVTGIILSEIILSRGHGTVKGKRDC